MKGLLYVGMFCMLLNSFTFSEALKRKFIVSDEATNTIVYVDQLNNKNWKFPIPSIPYVSSTSRSLQLIGNNRLLIGTENGNYYIIDIATGELKKTGSFNPEAKATSVYLLENGHFVGAYENGNDRYVFEADSSGKVIDTVKFSGYKSLRLTTLSANNTFLFGSDNTALECDWDGKVVWSVTINMPNNVPQAQIWKALRLPNGNTVVSTGYQASLLVVSHDKQIIKTIGGKNQPGNDSIKPNFFGGFQVLKNGHYAVTNWQGHGGPGVPSHGGQGVQILEYDTSGQLVWSFKDPTLYSSVHNLLFLDSLNTQYLNDESKGYWSSKEPVGVINNRSVVPLHLSGKVVRGTNDYRVLLSGKICPSGAGSRSASSISLFPEARNDANNIYQLRTNLR